MRKSGLTGDEAYMLSKREKTTEDLDQLKKELGLLKEDMTSKADKTTLAQTNRKLDALWKLNQGISYKFEEDNKEAYQKAIPTGAKLGSVKSVAGKTIVWNWLSDVTIKTGSRNGIDYVPDGKNISLNGSATSYTEIMTSKTALPVPILKGHKYYISTGLTESMSGLSAALGGTNMSVSTQTKEIKTCATGTTKLRFLICAQTGTTLNNTVITPKLVDLTKLFGAGKEPSTPEEFEAMFPADYYEYNEGELMSAPVNEVIEQGKNLWDEEWELGQISSSTGEIVQPSTEVISRNFILIEPSEKYFIYVGDKKYSTNIKGRFYDIDKKYIGYLDWNSKQIFPNTTFKAPNNAYYFKFSLQNSYGTIYKNDIAIIKGSTGSYSPYRNNLYEIPQEILDLLGYGSSAGDVYNEVDWENKQYIQRIGSVDLSTLTWNYNNENQFFYVSDANVPQDIAYRYNAAIGLLCEKYEYKGDGAVQVLKIADDYTMYSYCDKAYIKPSLRLKNSLYTNVTEFKRSLQGITLYYEFSEPIVTDISDLIPEGFLESLEVEPSGTLTFKNTNGDGYRIPVKSSEEYVVKLSEIAGGTE